VQTSYAIFGISLWKLTTGLLMSTITAKSSITDAAELTVAKTVEGGWSLG